MMYNAFYNTFLAEMPARTPGESAFAPQLMMIQMNVANGEPVTEVEPGIYKYTVNDDVTYWAGEKDASYVSIIVDTNRGGKFQKVNLSSKNPDIPAGSPPFASDMYFAIKKDAESINLAFSSDYSLSDDGARLWKGIVRRGYTVSVFDTTTNEYVLSKIENMDQFSEYYGDINKKRYMFVLSGSLMEFRGIEHYAAILDIKRRCGYNLFEEFKK